MSRIIRIFFCATALLTAVAVHGQGKIEGRGDTKRFISEKYGFSIAVPAGWLVDPSKDTPIYFSFSPSEGNEFNHQLKLPRGGAIISVVAQESLPGHQPSNLSEWAARDARGVSAESPSIRPLEMPPETGGAATIISSYDTATYGPDDQSEHRVNIFWEFRQQRFVAHLLYPARDSKGPIFEKVLLDTIRGIRPIEKSAKQ
jgi:hypothetical protein